MYIHRHLNHLRRHLSLRALEAVGLDTRSSPRAVAAESEETTVCRVVSSREIGENANNLCKKMIKNITNKIIIRNVIILINTI